LLARKWLRALGQWVRVGEQLVWLPALVLQVALVRAPLEVPQGYWQLPDSLIRWGSNQQRNPTTLG